MSQDEAATRQRAVALLARREYSEKELVRKLVSRDLDDAIVDQVIQELKKEGLQSDERYTDAYVTSRINRGYGPVRISHELQKKGISPVLIEEIMEEYQDQWVVQIEQVRKKKFGTRAPADYKEQARQSRFLQYRGFHADQIRKCFKSGDE